MPAALRLAAVTALSLAAVAARGPAATGSPLEAAFAARSYAPGARARLLLRGGGVPVLRVRLYRAGAGGEGPLQGAPVGRWAAVERPGGSVAVRLGSWPSGLYYARVEAAGRGTWYAPFVLRPRRLGEHRVAVVLPTNTWQAYNFEDGDSWYLHPQVKTVLLDRPYLDGGVPPHYHGYDRGFLRWLALAGKRVDVLADDDLERVRSGDALARAYDLVVFSGHEEYVTGHEYDVTQRYRDLGGNLAFLSANDFFYEVTVRGERMVGRRRWRDLGRPEAALVGEQYVDWNHDRYPNRPFRVTGARRAPWLFGGSGLADGDTFGEYGIEVDATAPSSPPGTEVLARIPDVFGPGVTAEMTYYETRRGARVFSAGVMNFGGSALWPQVRVLLANLWAHLSRP